MGTALCIVRTSLVLWFCLGAQVHLSLDHAAYLHDAAAHATGVPVTLAPGEESHASLHCACGTLSPPHEHRGHHVVHDHEINAVSAKSAYRSQLIVSAILPALPVGALLQAAPVAIDTDPVRISKVYFSRESAPRAPPSA